jgi:hypothetical protein
MENTPLDELLADALELCAKDFPRAKQKLDAFNAAFERIDERDEHGNLTRAAHDARQYLRSDLLDMRPYQRAKKEVEKQRRKAKAKAETAIAQALAAYVIYKQWDIEAGLLSDKDDGTRLVPKSREDHTRDGIARIAEPFVQDMIARGVTPAAISRRRSSEADVIAQLIQSAHEDPKYEDPDNPWVAIYRSGHIDAYRTGVTEDEARLLDAALALRDEEAAEALEKARAFLPDGLTVSTGVALGAARIMQSTSTLSDGLAQAYADAHNLVRDKDAEQLGRLLGIDTEPGLVKLQVLLNFLRVQSVSTHPPLPAWVEIDVMRRVIDTQNAHVKPATEWVGKVTEKLGNLAEVFGSRLSSEDAFYALLSAAMHSSFTYRHFENEADIRAAKDAELNRLRLMRGAVLEGRAFKIDGFGFPVCEDEEGFDELDAEVYQALVLDEQDGPKGETNSDRSAGETPAYSASNAQDQRLNPVLVPIEPEWENNGGTPLEPDPADLESRKYASAMDEDEEGEEVDFYAIVARSDDDDDDIDNPEDASENVELARWSTASLERRAYDREGLSSLASASLTADNGDDHGSAKSAEQVSEPVQKNQSARSARRSADGHKPPGSDKAPNSSQGVAKRALPLFEEEKMVWEDD